MILVTGATGYIGNRLVKKLANEGHKVRAMVIENDPLLEKLEGVDCEIVKGDITRKETLGPCLEGVKTVFHLAAVLVSHDPDLFHKINYEGTKNLVDASVEAGVKHFVCISAAAAVYRVRTTYGESKAESEALMMKKRGNTNFTIIRPTLLYGSGGSQELKRYVVNLRKFPLVVPVVGMGKARKRPVWLNDIVNGLSLLVDKPVSYGKIYNFSGGTDVSMWEYTKLICKTFGINKPMIPVPVFLCYAVAFVWKLFSKNPILQRDQILGVTMDANGSCQEATDDIGYKPADLYETYAMSFEDGGF
jgi:nucleoside-diphosphate-sugar epimerase